MAKEWTIQVTLERDERWMIERSRFKGVNVELLITEILRYAGVVSILKGREEGPEMVFCVHRARGKGTEDWATMNSNRIKSFGIRAMPVEWGL